MSQQLQRQIKTKIRDLYQIRNLIPFPNIFEDKRWGLEFNFKNIELDTLLGKRYIVLNRGSSIIFTEDGLFLVQVPGTHTRRTFHIDRHWKRYQYNDLNLITRFEKEDPQIHQMIDDLLLFGRSNQKISPQRIMDVRNVTLRWELIQRFGPEEFLEQFGAKILDQGGTNALYAILMQDSDDSFNVLKVEDSTTRRLYFLRVPPSCTGVKDAIAWTFGLTPDQYHPIIET